MRLEVLGVEPLGEDEHAVELAVQEEAHRRCFRRNPAGFLRDVVGERVGEVAVVTNVVVDDEVANRLRRPAEQHVGRELPRAVLAAEVQPKSLSGRRLPTATAVDADTDAGCEPKLTVVEVCDGPRALPLAAVLEDVGQDAPLRI